MNFEMIILLCLPLLLIKLAGLPMYWDLEINLNILKLLNNDIAFDRHKIIVLVGKINSNWTGLEYLYFLANMYSII